MVFRTGALSDFVIVDTHRILRSVLDHCLVLEQSRACCDYLYGVDAFDTKVALRARVSSGAFKESL